jgi:hypothetical protein
MTKEELEITEIVKRETKAWDNKDVDYFANFIPCNF